MKLLSDRVLVKIEEAPATSASGLLCIPDAARETPLRGAIVAMGNGKIDEPMPLIAIGDIVLFGRYSGTDLVIDGAPHLLVRASDLLAVIN